MGAAAVAASASANLEVLRAGLEREAQQRVQLGAETAEQLKQILGAGWSWLELVGAGVTGFSMRGEPLVNVYITMEHHHFFNRKINNTWPFSMAIVNYLLQAVGGYLFLYHHFPNHPFILNQSPFYIIL